MMATPGSRWKLLRRLLVAAFLIAVAVLLVRQAMQVEWSEVGAAMRAADPLLLLAAAALAAISYAFYASYDLLARRHIGHSMRPSRVAAIALVSYAFNLNMGALIGGAGFRFRLYSQFGLQPGTIAGVLTFSVATNWGGYVLLGGLALTLQWIPLPLKWQLGSELVRWLGIGMLVAAAAYPLLCAFSPRREFTIRGRELRLPSWRMALLQLALSTLNWMTIAGIVWLLLPSGPDYPIVLGVLLAAAVAGALAHVPAGLGVLEAVFVLSLGGRLGTSAVLAALLLYRAIYYLVPLALAVVLYVLLERRAVRRSRRSGVGDRRREKTKARAVRPGPSPS